MSRYTPSPNSSHLSDAFGKPFMAKRGDERGFKEGRGGEDNQAGILPSLILPLGPLLDGGWKAGDVEVVMQ